MPFEPGGRADKLGNRYEINWIVLKILDIVSEKIEAIKIEAIGDDELGTDIWIKYKDGHKEAQQCKGRNASNEYWTISDLNKKSILENWKFHLQRDSSTVVSLVSPLSFINFSDLIFRASTNDNAENFVKYQVNNSSEIKKLFESYVRYMGLSSEADIHQIISFLRRTKIRQEPYPENEEYITDNINRYFIGDPSTIKSKLINFILQGSIFGKWITSSDLDAFFIKEKIEFRNLLKDKRILPRIKTLNADYKNRFQALKNGLITRSEFENCKKYILEGKSIVIHGKAGNGKSGLTQNIIDWCDENRILHLDIKLDTHIPQNSAESWGKEMGFPSSISYCLDSLSKNKNVVLILDQLDALRWTARNSRNSIATCLELIREIKTINLDKDKKISIVFVCRSYDLEYDNGIKSLFKDDGKENNCYWNKVEVNEFSEVEVEGILGSKYLEYPKKLKQLLRTASNLYIWEQIGNKADYYQITSTYNLVEKWWGDISENCHEASLSPRELNHFKTVLIDVFIQTGCVSFSKRRIFDFDWELRYLTSQGLLIERENKISFVHQSFLDCFAAKQMINLYYSDYDIENIIGDRTQQNPNRRYQFHIFLQSLLEISEDDFLNFGDKLIKKSSIRFSFRYVFFEILGSIETPSSKVMNYVKKLVIDKKYKNHLCQTVIFGNKSYVNFLVKQGILYDWLNEDNQLVCDLLASISPYFSNESIKLISDSFENSDDKSIWTGCFMSDYHKDSKDFFMLRLKFWESYNKNSIWFGNLYKNVDSWTIQIVQFLLNKYPDEELLNQLYNDNKDFDLSSKEYIRKNIRK